MNIRFASIIRSAFSIIFFLLLCAFCFTEEQLISTQLHVTVRNELGNTEEGATIKLFENEEDHKNEKNVVQEGITDKRGIVKFKELKPIPYFVLVSKGDKNNFDGGEQTGKLEESRINKVTIIIE